MSPHWPVKKIDEVCNLMTGGTPSKSKNEYFEGGEVKWLVSGDIHRKEILDCDGRITEQGLKNSNAKYLPVNSVMIALNGQGKTRGTVALLRTQATCNQSLVSISPKDSTLLLPEYLFANLHGRYQEIRRITGDDGNDRRGLNMNLVRNIELPIAPLPEQKRIVAILDQAFAGIDAAVANTEKNLANARELFESYLNGVFTRKGDGCVEKTLGDVCDLLGGFAFKSTDAVDVSNVQLIRMGNLYQNVLDLNRKPSFYPEDFAEKHSRYILSEGDLIISLTGTVDKEDYGFTVEIPATDRVLLLNQRIAKFINICEDYIDRRYLLYFLRSKVFLKLLYGSARGVRQANLSSVTMKKLPIDFPELKKQIQLVETFSALESDVKNLESIYQQKLTALAELKQSILQKAFAGKL